MNLKFWTWGKTHNATARGDARPTGRRTELPGLMSDEEREAAYLQAPGHALFAAVVADLREFAVEVSDRGLDVELSDQKLRWHMGGSDALLEFLDKLQDREYSARLTQEQLERKKAEEQEGNAEG